MTSPLYLPAGDGKQILRNDAPSHIALESPVAFVGRSPHRKRMLQRADGGFPARSFSAEKNPRSAVASRGACPNQAWCCCRAGIQAWVSAALPS